MGENSISLTTSMAKSKRASAWKHVEDSIALMAESLRMIDGVISVHAQYAEPVAVTVVLVATEAAKKAVRRLEDRLFFDDADFPIDLHIHQVNEADLCSRQDALDSSYGRVWSRQ